VSVINPYKYRYRLKFFSVLSESYLFSFFGVNGPRGLSFSFRLLQKLTT
jgi:hypothetical protein